MRVEVEFRGLENVRKFFETRAALVRHAPVVEIYADGERNQAIAEAQANSKLYPTRDRNPFFFSPQERGEIRQRMADGISEAVRTGSVSSLRRAFEAIGRLMVTFVQRHIDTGKSGGRPPVRPLVRGHAMTPLKKDYAEEKKRKWGTQPILVASGQFYRSIKSRVR